MSPVDIAAALYIGFNLLGVGLAGSMALYGAYALGGRSA